MHPRAWQQSSGNGAKSQYGLAVVAGERGVEIARRVKPVDAA
jgi:hypothetical protein